jgi:parallel beta-helix repeat protein
MSEQRTSAKRRWRLREVLIFSVPPFLLALYVFGASVWDYHRLSQFDDWWSQRGQTARNMKFRLRSALNVPKAVALEHALSPEDTSRAGVSLLVDRRKWDRLQGDAAMMQGEHVNCDLMRGGRARRVELRLRGDTSVHWTSEKKTLRVTSPRDDLFKGQRDWAFSVKQVLTQYVANSLSEDFELLAPESEIVPVYLNRRFYGISRAFAPVSETFLRNAQRLPGNVFRGDTAERGEYFKGLPRDLFRNPAIWDRVASVNSGPGADSDVGLVEWLELLNGKTFEAHLAFMQRMDTAELSRLLALLLLVGDPYHMSGVHNQLWYEDPSSGLMHPIVWDLRVLDLDRPPPGSELNGFWRSALRNPEILSGALAELHARGPDAIERARELATSAWRTHTEAFEFDGLRAGVISETGRPQEIVAQLRENHAELERRIADARGSMRLEYVGNRWILDLSVEGWAALELRGFEAPSDGREPLVLTADSNRNGVLDTPDSRSATPMRLPPGCRAERKLEPEAMHYRWFLHGPGAATNRPMPLFVNAHTGEPVALKELEHGERLPAGASWHPWSYPGSPPARQREWSGATRLDEDVLIPAGEELVLAPGTELLLAPDVSILARGKITAIGTAEAPIVIRQMVAGTPWGTIALQGEGADGSRFAHVRFEGGGGDVLERVQYKGMVCAHWTRDVRFESCEFSRNLRCDDALNAVHSEVDLNGCYFHDVNADAADYDYSIGMIESCTIERAGNDGIDLMSCAPTIAGNTIVDSGDKGISIGERSAPFVFDNRISGCVIGIEVKDLSRPAIVHCELRGNGTGLLSGAKNWRYGGGGRPILVRTRVSGNQTDFDQGASSHASLHQTLIGPPSDQGSPTATAEGDIEWLLGPAGMRSNRGVAGCVPGWSRRKPFEVLGRAVLRDTFERPERHWQLAGGVRRIERYEGLLEADLRGPSGRLGLRHALDLTDASRRYQLVLELAGEGLSGVRAGPVPAGAGASDVPETRSCKLGRDAREFAFTVIDLAPGEYAGLFFELESPAGRGRLRIADWRVIAMGELTWAGKR